MRTASKSFRGPHNPRSCGLLPGRGRLHFGTPTWNRGGALRIAPRPGSITLQEEYRHCPRSLRIAPRPGSITLAWMFAKRFFELRIAPRPGSITLSGARYPRVGSCGLLPGRGRLHSEGVRTLWPSGCGLLPGRGRLHYLAPNLSCRKELQQKEARKTRVDVAGIRWVCAVFPRTRACVRTACR